MDGLGVHKKPWDTAGTKDFALDKWELYDLSKDFRQADDVAADNPEKLNELQAIFDREAKKHNAYPQDDRAAARFANPGGTNRPSLPVVAGGFILKSNYATGSSSNVSADCVRNCSGVTPVHLLKARIKFVRSLYPSSLAISPSERSVHLSIRVASSARVCSQTWANVSPSAARRRWSERTLISASPAA